MQRIKNAAVIAAAFIAGFVAFVAMAEYAAGADLTYTYTSGYSVTGTAAKGTLQLASSATRTVFPKSLNITCETAACTLTLIRNGTAATATEGTVVKNRTSNPTAQAKFYSASDSSSGTSYVNQPFPSGGVAFVELGDIEVAPGENLTFSVASTSSQRITIAVKWQEH
jgi:hypothetical protein